MQAQLNIPCTVYHWTCDIHVHAVWCTACIQHAQHKDKKFIAHIGISSFPSRAPLEKTLKCWKARPAWETNARTPSNLPRAKGYVESDIMVVLNLYTQVWKFFSRAVCRSRLCLYLFAPVASCIVLRGQTQPGATVPVPFVYIVLVNVHTLCIYVL